jgi:anti-sigma factor RsiW
MTHDEVLALLPTLVNGTLEPDRREELERHLEDCAPCRAELAAERRLSAALATAPPAPAEDLLARTLARIDAEEAERAPARAPRREPAWERIARAWNRWWRPLPVPARVLVAVQFALLLVLGGAVLQQPEPEGELRTLSGTAGGAPAAGRGRLLVLFEEDAPAGEVRRLLRAAGASIVDGPSAAGYYAVEVSVGDDPAVDLTAAAAALAARPDLVELASPVPRGAP